MKQSDMTASHKEDERSKVPKHHHRIKSPVKKQTSHIVRSRSKGFDFSTSRISKAMKRSGEINISTLQSPRPSQDHVLLQKISPSIKKHIAVNLVLPRHEEPKLKWRLGECLEKNKMHGCSIHKGLNLLNGQLMIVHQIDKLLLTPAQLECIRRKVETLANLEKHPHLVNVIAVQDDRDVLNVLSEYVPCGDIKKLLDQFGALDERVVRTFSAQTLLALRYLHTKDVFLQSLTTTAIQVGQNSCVKVSPLTPLLSEVIYVNARPKVTDIRALGCIMIEMLTGEPVSASQSLQDFSGAASRFLKQALAVNENSCEIDAILLSHEFISQAESHISVLM